MSVFKRKYNTATHVYVPMIKRAAVDYAVGADWTPAAGDVKVVIDGTVSGNIGTLPSAITSGNTALWDFTLTGGETTGKKIQITVADSATKAVEDQCIEIETYGHASAEYPTDYSAASTAQTGDAFARLGAPAGASVSADIATVAGYIDTEVGSIKTKTDFLPSATAGAAGGLFIAGANAATTVNITGNLTGNVSGSVGSLTTNNDKTGYRLSGTGVDDIWDEDATTHSTADSTGQALQDAGGAGTPPTVSEIAAGVWDEPITLATHDVDKSAGQRLRRISPVQKTTHAGTAQAGGASTITLDAGASGANDFYKGAGIDLETGTGSPDFGIITSYNGTTKVATVETAWTTPPDNTTTFRIAPLTAAKVHAFSTQALSQFVLIDTGYTSDDALPGSVAGIAGALGSSTIEGFLSTTELEQFRYQNGIDGDASAPLSAVPHLSTFDPTADNVIVGDILASALIRFITRDSGSTYGSAVAGSLAKVLVEAVGTAASPFTAQDARQIRYRWGIDGSEEVPASNTDVNLGTVQAELTTAGLNAVLDKAYSGHTTAGTVGGALSTAGTNADSAGVTTLLSRIGGAITISAGKVAVDNAALATAIAADLSGDFLTLDTVIDGLTFESIVAALLATQLGVTDVSGSSVDFMAQDGTTPKVTITYGAGAGERTASVVS
jgi:hypothetical protein